MGNGAEISSTGSSLIKHNWIVILRDKRCKQAEEHDKKEKLRRCRHTGKERGCSHGRPHRNKDRTNLNELLFSHFALFFYSNSILFFRLDKNEKTVSITKLQ